VNLFLDSSVAIAASLSATGASREVFNQAARQGWRLLVSPWVLREVRDNLANKAPAAAHAWVSLRARVAVEDDELIFDWPIVFEASKDKPVLFTALACADVLLTLDRHDFGALLGQTIYGLRVLTPGEFLRTERGAGRIR
jgi:predicted nucleic acid-binding protein